MWQPKMSPDTGKYPLGGKNTPTQKKRKQAQYSIFHPYTQNAAITCPNIS